MGRRGVQERGVCAFAHDAAKGGHQIGSSGTQFVVMMKRQFARTFSPFGVSASRTSRRSSSARVRWTKPPASRRFTSSTALWWRICMRFANSRIRGRTPGRHALDGQHQLILAPLQACILYHLLAEVKEAADLVTELRQCLVVGQGKLLHAADCIVQRSSSTLHSIS